MSMVSRFNEAADAAMALQPLAGALLGNYLHLDYLLLPFSLQQFFRWQQHSMSAKHLDLKQE